MSSSQAVGQPQFEEQGESQGTGKKVRPNGLYDPGKNDPEIK